MIMDLLAQVVYFSWHLFLIVLDVSFIHVKYLNFLDRTLFL